MPKISKSKILAGRKAVEAYREAHRLLHSKPWHRGIPEEHTPLLEKMVDALEKLGFTSIETDFEKKKTEILAKFCKDNEALCLVNTGIYEEDIWRLREDAAMLGEPISQNGVELVEYEGGRELIIDGSTFFAPHIKEHASMINCVKDCPSSARVFIAGLGLGLILLYLAKSGKAKETIVCEVESRVIDLLSPRINSYLGQHYPNFNCQIIQGDAFSKVFELGKFDWLFFDTTLGNLEINFREVAKEALTLRGVYTAWHRDIYMEWS